jgi:hypothetical protein
MVVWDGSIRGVYVRDLHNNAAATGGSCGCVSIEVKVDGRGRLLTLDNSGVLELHCEDWVFA